MILEPPFHAGAGWEFSVRDDPGKSILGKRTKKRFEIVTFENHEQSHGKNYPYY
jgi:hypothetical protein